MAGTPEIEYRGQEAQVATARKVLFLLGNPTDQVEIAWQKAGENNTLVSGGFLSISALDSQKGNFRTVNGNDFETFGMWDAKTHSPAPVIESELTTAGKNLRFSINGVIGVAMKFLGTAEAEEVTLRIGVDSFGAKTSLQAARDHLTIYSEQASQNGLNRLYANARICAVGNPELSFRTDDEFGKKIKGETFEVTLPTQEDIALSDGATARMSMALTKTLDLIMAIVPNAYLTEAPQEKPAVASES